MKEATPLSDMYCIRHIIRFLAHVAISPDEGIVIVVQLREKSKRITQVTLQAGRSNLGLLVPLSVHIIL